LLALWGEVAASVAAAGFPKLILFNSHGGQTALVDLAAVDWRVRRGLLVARAHWTAFGAPPGLFDATEWQQGLHGGEVETALMLHLAPALVRMEVAENFVPAGPVRVRGDTWLGLEAPIGVGWSCTDLHTAGACGHAAAANAEQGAALLEHLARALVELVDDMAATPWPVQGSGPT
jgi:creatinine amidohydrolase